MKRVLAREEAKPLFIILEHSNPMVVISTHILITNDPKLAPRYPILQEQAVTHFEDILILLGDDN